MQSGLGGPPYLFCRLEVFCEDSFFPFSFKGYNLSGGWLLIRKKLAAITCVWCISKES